MSPPLAFGWYIWTRHRRGLTVLGVYWLTGMIFCRAAPDGTFEYEAGGSITYAKVVFALFCQGAIVSFGYLLLVFSFSREVRLEACESGFPLRLRALPVGTRALAGWPMLWGSATMMLGWLTLAWTARRPWGFDVALGWPALLLAVIVAWMQAIVWTPFPLPWVRALLLVPLSSLLIVIPPIFLKFDVTPIDVSPNVGYVLLVALLLAAYGIAIHGVACARRGDETRWVGPARPPWKRTARLNRPPFASAARAQLWFEWRRSGLAFPLTVAFTTLFWLPWPMSTMPLEASSFWLTATVLLFFLMFLLASACGVVMGRLIGRKQSRALSSFLATRPLSDGSMVRAKFEAAALSTLAGWAVLGSALLIWAVFGGHAETIRQHLSANRFWASLLLFFGGGFVLTWAQMVGHLWMGLTRHVSMVAKLILSSPVTLMGIVVGLQAVKAFELRQAFVDLLPWLTSAAVVLKCLAATWSLNRLKRKALVSPRVLIVALAVWCILAIGLWAVARWLIPNDAVPLSGLLLGIALLLPLTRLALAPLALAWNRHR